MIDHMRSHCLFNPAINNAKEGIFGSTFATIITGVTVFIISQYFLELVIKPYVNYKKVKSEVLNRLKYYSNVIGNPLDFAKVDVIINPLIEDIERYKKASDEIRNLSCELEAHYYNNSRIIRSIFIKDNVEEAGSLLIGLSNSLIKLPFKKVPEQAIDNSQNIDKIKAYLNMVGKNR